MTKNKSIGGAEKLNTGEAHSLVIRSVMILRDGQWNDKRNIMSRVHSHHLSRTHRPIQPLYPAARMLYDQRSCIYGLAIPHLSTSPHTLSLSLSLTLNEGRIQMSEEEEGEEEDR